MTNSKTLTLRSFDVPQLHKFGIGFDSLFDDLMRVSNLQSNSNYPPHNVIKTGEDTVTIEVAVAGFAEGEIDIALEKRLLTISGARKHADNENHEYLLQTHIYSCRACGSQKCLYQGWYFSSRT